MAITSRCARHTLRASLGALALLATCTGAHAGNLTVQVTDATGQPVVDAVIYAEAAGGQTMPKALRSAVIEQKARKFAPVVSVVQTGTEISFPNNDTVRHHVYSFSTPKVFELKLYSGTPGSPILFDKPGTVVVGCNIHDQMLAYIHIVDTPYFGRTDAAGKVQIDAVATGKYNLKYWHYKTPATGQIQAQSLTMTAADMTSSFRVAAKSAADN